MDRSPGQGDSQQRALGMGRPKCWPALSAGLVGVWVLLFPPGLTPLGEAEQGSRKAQFSEW